MTIHAGSVTTHLRSRILSRHIEATRCAAPLVSRAGVATTVKCGYSKDHAVHDLYPIVSKRDRLSWPFNERDRHDYQPTGRGVCAADEDEWPCAAYQLAMST